MEKNQKLSFTKLREELVALSTDELKSTLGGCFIHGESGNCPIDYQYLDLFANDAQAMGYNLSGFDIGHILCGTFDGGFSEGLFPYPWDPYEELEERADMLFTENGGDVTILWDPTDPGMQIQQVLGTNMWGEIEVYNFETESIWTMNPSELSSYQTHTYYQDLN